MTIPRIKKRVILGGLGLTVFLLLVLAVPSTWAHDLFYLRKIDFPLNENYSLVSENQEVKIEVKAQSINEDLILKLTTIATAEEIADSFKYSDELRPASDLYALKISSSSGQPFVTQPVVTVSYQEDDHYKEIYYYDETEAIFKKITSDRDTLNQKIYFSLPQTSKIIFAVFDEPELQGMASWYVHKKYRGQLIAASRDFVQDAKVKVINLDNNKEVVVTIKDYGPKRCDEWTEKEIRKMGTCQNRVIDLSKEAFSKLAPTSRGMLKVKIVPLVEQAQN